MITACLVVHNQENLLERCLQSIRDVVDEIVMVHDGPASDSTRSLARKFSARLFENAYVGEAEWHRPFSYQQAKGDWILQIDADEFLSQKLAREIRMLTQSKNIDGYYFAWPYFDGKKYLQTGPFAKTLKAVLFRKSEMFMVGVVHEYPRSYGKVMQRRDLLLEHKPAADNFTEAAFREKWIKWAKIQAKQIYDIDQAPTYNIPDKSQNALIKYYRNLVKYPLLNAAVETVKFLIIYLIRGILFSGSKSWFIAFLEIKYLWWVRWEILKLKNEKK